MMIQVKSKKVKVKSRIGFLTFAFLLFTCFLIVPIEVWGQVAWGTSTSNTGIAVTSLTVTITPAATANTLLICSGQGTSSNPFSDLFSTGVTGITYNSVAMTLVNSVNASGGADAGVEMYQRVLGTPDGSAHNAVIGTGGNGDPLTLIGSCATFTGVDQSTPTGATASSVTDPMTSSLTVPANGMGYDVAISGRGYDCSSPITATGSGQTQRFQVCLDLGGTEDNQGLGSTRATSGTFSWSAAGGYNAQLAVAINAASAAAAVTRRRILNQ